MENANINLHLTVLMLKAIVISYVAVVIIFTDMRKCPDLYTVPNLLLEDFSLGY